MSCIPASHSMNSLLSQLESEVDGGPGERRGSRAYQIFPEPNVDEDSDPGSYPEDLLYRRERLPSIVVEPTELTGGQSWCARCPQGDVEDEEEDSGAERTEGERQDETEAEDGPVHRKPSIGPSQSQVSLSRLTPPASPTPPEAAPPCLRS